MSKFSVLCSKRASKAQEVLRAATRSATSETVLNWLMQLFLGRSKEKLELKRIRKINGRSTARSFLGLVQLQAFNLQRHFPKLFAKLEAKLIVPFSSKPGKRDLQALASPCRALIRAWKCHWRWDCPTGCTRVQKTASSCRAKWTCPSLGNTFYTDNVYTIRTKPYATTQIWIFLVHSCWKNLTRLFMWVRLFKCVHVVCVEVSLSDYEPVSQVTYGGDLKGSWHELDVVGDCVSRLDVVFTRGVSRTYHEEE